ncbi:MAG: GatB/YqeY domain-containing protein, partial [Candidatus Heimdallarchaeota archaeon]
LQDDQVTAILKRMKKDAIIMGNLNEVEILNKYLPTILGETQIKTIVGGIIQKNGYSGMQNMGKVMGTLKTHPMSAQIDNKIASRITKDLLTQ